MGNGGGARLARFPEAVITPPPQVLAANVCLTLKPRPQPLHAIASRHPVSGWCMPGTRPLPREWSADIGRLAHGSTRQTGLEQSGVAASMPIGVPSMASDIQACVAHEGR